MPGAPPAPGGRWLVVALTALYLANCAAWWVWFGRRGEQMLEFSAEPETKSGRP